MENLFSEYRTEKYRVLGHGNEWILISLYYENEYENYIYELLAYAKSKI